jgi:hypothetical protein
VPALSWASLRLFLGLWTAFAAWDAHSVEFTFAGFGTVGYAISDEPFRYLRYIDDGGTLKADSLLGFQADAKFTPQWSATVQAVFSAPHNHDHGYETTIQWAFASYRPGNSWLLRAGRLRPPVFINTQNSEVGVTYDVARLPVEVYKLSPTYDFEGGAITKTWTLPASEINLDAYLGESNVTVRLPYQRDLQSSPYFPSKLALTGIVLSYASGPLFLRGGAHYVHTRLNQPIPATFDPVDIPGPPPIGGTLWLPPKTTSTSNLTLLTFGADWRSSGWRFTGEYARLIANDTKLGFNTTSGYATIAREIGSWTPYLTYARLISGADTRSLYRDVNSTPVPTAAQFLYNLPATFHQKEADAIFVYDQYSTMLGTSYTLSPNSKLKLEWMHVNVGLASVFVDGDVHNRSFNVYSLSYSFAF